MKEFISGFTGVFGKWTIDYYAIGHMIGISVIAFTAVVIIWFIIFLVLSFFE